MLDVKHRPQSVLPLCVPTPWMQTGLVICFDWLNAAEVAFWEPKPRLAAALASMWMGWVLHSDHCTGWTTCAFPLSGCVGTNYRGCSQHREGSRRMLQSWWPSCFRHKGLQPAHPGGRLQCFSGVGRGAFARRIVLPWREVNLLRVTEVTLCHLSLGLEGKKVPLWHWYPLH